VIIAGIEAIRNITARKEIEKYLRQERDRNQRYLDLAGVILVAIDRDQKIILINRKGCDLLEYDGEELIGKNWFDVAIPPALRDEIKSVYSRIMSGVMRQVEFYENVVVSKTGQQRTIAWHNSSLQDDAGNIIGTLSSGEDITSRKLAELALTQSEQRFRRLIESVTDYIYSAEVESGRVVRTNHGPGCASVTGYTSEEYWNDPELWNRMIFDADRNTVIDQTKSILSGKPIAPFEHRIIHKDGSIRWIRNTSVPHYDAEGRLAYYDGLIADITPVKTLENQLRQAQKMEAVGQLAGGVAHDFNNILTAIIGYAHLLLMKIHENDPLRAFLDPILVSAERASHLTSSLLAFSRKQVSDLRPVDLNKIVKRVEHLLVSIIGENFEFQTKLSSQNMMVLADSMQIEQVLMNLSTNARDSMPNGGTLLFRTEEIMLAEDFVRNHSYGIPGQYVSLSVSDTGIGIDENTQSKIFEPFFTTKEVGKGTGLGLSIVYGVIKQHNGFIDVSSAPGKGSTFTIYLPLLTTSDADKSASDPAASTLKGTETVLVAEDNKSVRDLIRFVLEGSGYAVVDAVDGVDAVDKFFDSQKTIDLLIFDIIMPKKNGNEAYQEIIKKRPDIKVLFMSGYTADVAHKYGILDAGLAVILKPITPSDLLKKVRAVLDGK
jgi:two-component system cell cycle sensor histidine kinase/response regulator CckA